MQEGTILTGRAETGRAEIGSERAPRPWRWAEGWRATVGAFVVAEVVTGVLSVFRAVRGGMPETFDLGNYEYYSGYAQIHGFRGPLALPGMLQTYLDMELNTLYYLLISQLHAREAVAAIALAQSLAVALLAVSVWALARRAGGSPLAAAAGGFLAGVGAFYAPIYGIELGHTSSDALLALPLIAAAALLYRTVTVSGLLRAGLRETAAAGLLLGIAGALKFTTVPFVAAILLGFLAALLSGRSRPAWDLRRCLLLVGLSAGIALVTAVALYLPTALLLWHRYHDPLFPYFNSVFHSSDLLPGSFRDQRWTARSPVSFVLHYTRLLVGGDNLHNGTSQWPVRSPVMFFGVGVTTLALVAELVTRRKPGALFLEFSLVVGFALSEAVFGIYRYLAPVEMTSAAVVISLVFIYRIRPRVTLLVVAAGLAVGSLFAIGARLGSTRAFSPSYFAIRPGAFSDLSGAGVVMAGPGPLGYLVPYLPADTELVRAGGNLDQVMSDAWWAHVASVARASHTAWWVVYQAGTVTQVPAALRQIGFSGSFTDCHVVGTELTNLKVCRLPRPAG